MSTAASQAHRIHVLAALLALISLLTFASPLGAQTFQTVPALSFTKAFAGAEPLPQVLTIAYSDQTSVRFSVATSTSSGGSWLSASPAGNGCCFTPLAIQVIVNAGTLAAGTYTGQVTITNFSNSSINMTIPVNLTVAASGATFFDDLPGKLSFSMKTSGSITSQAIQVRNAGSGSLNWTVSASTASGSAWLKTSAASGTAPSTVTVSVDKTLLPGGGATNGTFLGQLLFQGSGDSVTIPVAVTVGPTVFEQINPLNFTMPFGGDNPLPQVVNVEMNDNSTVRYNVSVANAKGGNWLSVGPSGNGCCFTPLAETVTVTPGTIAAGTYTAQIHVTEFANPQRVMVVPVTLTVLPSGAFFGDLPGQLSFSIKTNAATATAQTIRVNNGGSGTLNWTLTSNTADGGNWLTTSPASGTAPSAVSVGVNVSQLPGGGALAGEFVGQLVFQTAGDTTTVPITVTVGTAPFTQLNPISFTMPFGGANPLTQTLNVATIDNSTVRFNASAATGTGGNWLSISPSGNGCCFTPLVIAASINASTLAAGTYTGEIIITEFANPQRSMVIPVNLNIVASGAFFADLPGGLSFNLKPSGTPVSQLVAVNNGGSTGTLSWTARPSTADGGAWLTVTPASGTAPSLTSVSITPANLPGGGALSGTFLGQVVFQSGTDTTTVPVTVSVGTAVFTQMNPVSFSMPFGGTNPLPQVLNISTVDASAVRFNASVDTGNGGNWLSISPSGNGCCFTPLAITASVNSSGLSAGTYTGEIIITEFANPQRSMTIPVTLTVSASGAFYDNLPGGLTFSVQANKKATPQTLLVNNGGSGKLKFTVTPVTEDGGLWLTISPTTSPLTAPKALTVTVNILNLPGGGAIAGTYNGQLLLQAVGSTITATVPVTVNVNKAAFAQVNPLYFVMPFGGANPLPQVISTSSYDGTSIRYSASATTSKGGAWLSISPSGNGCCFTSLPVRVSISGGSLPVGNYTGEISILEFANPQRTMLVPVNLAVVASGKAFYDNLPGQTSFSFAPSSANPPAQTITVGNGGAGTLAWSVAPTTADPGKWIKVTPTKGSNAGTYTVSITTSKLPGKGLIAGTYIGQQVLKSKTGNVTIPTVVTVGDPVFVQQAALTFNTHVGVNPANQTLPINSTSTALRFTPLAAAGKGGNWLSVSPAGNGCCFTLTNLTVSVNASSLAAGTYVGEINILEFANPGKSMTVPVVLNVAP